jgi:hypothetical protein
MKSSSESTAPKPIARVMEVLCRPRRRQGGNEGREALLIASTPEQA